MRNINITRLFLIFIIDLVHDFIKTFLRAFILILIKQIIF